MLLPLGIMPISSDYVINWTTSDPSIGTVTNEGLFTAISPGTNYPEGELEGTYAVVENGSQLTIIREGYTVSSWGQSTFGRMMMYQVFSIDEAPTYWSNLDT